MAINEVADLDSRRELQAPVDSKVAMQELGREIAQDSKLQERVERFLEFLQLKLDNEHLGSTTTADEMWGHQVSFREVPIIGMTPDGRLIALMTNDGYGYHKRVVISHVPESIHEVEIMAPIVYDGISEHGGWRADYLTPDNPIPYGRAFMDDPEVGKSPVEERDYISIVGGQAIVHDGLSHDDTMCYSLAEVLHFAEDINHQAVRGKGRLVLEHAARQPQHPGQFAPAAKSAMLVI